VTASSTTTRLPRRNLGHNSSENNHMLQSYRTNIRHAMALLVVPVETDQSTSLTRGEMLLRRHVELLLLLCATPEENIGTQTFLSFLYLTSCTLLSCVPY